MLDISSVAVVIIRGIALWVIANAVSAIPAVLAMLKLVDTSTQTPDSFNLLIVIGALNQLSLAALLLIYAKKLARYMSRGQENVNLQIGEADYNSLQAVAFSVLGAYILIYAIPNLLRKQKAVGSRQKAGAPSSNCAVLIVSLASLLTT